MPNSKFLLALCQHASPENASKDAIFAVFEAQAREAAAKGAKLIVTQELFLAWYFCQGLDESRFGYAESIPGPSSQKIAARAKELKVTIHASLYEKATDGLYFNTSVTFGPAGETLGIYRKMHIPHDPRFEEKYYFAPGDLGFQCQETPVVKLGPLVCWDQWYPEAARATTLKGAQLLAYPTAIGYYNDAVKGEPAPVREAQREAWITAMRAHAIANGVFVVAANRVGSERELTFWGSSFICGPDGVIIAQGSQDKAEVVMAEIDLSRIEALRRGWPFLRDRRVDAYDGLLKRWGGK